MAEEVSGVVGDGRGDIGVDGFFLFFAIASSRDLPTDVSFLVRLVMAGATGGWPVVFTNGMALPPVLVDDVVERKTVFVLSRFLGVGVKP